MSAQLSSQFRCNYDCAFAHGGWCIVQHVCVCMIHVLVALVFPFLCDIAALLPEFPCMQLSWHSEQLHTVLITDPGRTQCWCVAGDCNSCCHHTACTLHNWWLPTCCQLRTQLVPSPGNLIAYWRLLPIGGCCQPEASSMPGNVIAYYAPVAAADRRPVVGTLTDSTLVVLCL